MLCCGMNGNCVPYADGLGYNGYRSCPSQVEIIKGDSNYLGITAIITVGMNLVSFFFAYKFQFDFLTDLTGSANFIVNALLPFLANKNFCDRQVMAVALLMCHAAMNSMPHLTCESDHIIFFTVAPLPWLRAFDTAAAAQ